MPGWANTQPVVIGDRVVTYAEPDLVVCCDANTGKILWTTTVNPWLAAGVDSTKAETARNLSGMRDALFLLVQLQWHFGTCGRYLSTNELNPVLQGFLDKDLPGFKATLQKTDPEGKYDTAWAECEQRIRAAITNPPSEKACWDYGKKFAIIDSIGKRIAAITGKKVPLEVPWGNMVGWCMSVPVSDGQFIYVSMGQGQTACLDLNGKIVWQTWFEQKDVSTHHVLSPVLADGILVDMHGNGTLRGLDAQTGKVVWEAPTAREPKSTKSGYYVASHRVVRQNGVAYLLTSQCSIIRIRDGKTVGAYDYGEAYGGGCPIAGWGDLFIKGANGDGWSEPFRVFRLKYESVDAVSAEKVWESKPGDYTSCIVSSNAVWLFNKDGAGFDPATGAVLCKGIGGEFRILAGNTLIWCGAGNKDPQGSHWSRRRDDGKAMMAFATADVTDPKAVKTLSQKNVLGGENSPRHPMIESFIPTTWRNPQFVNAKGGRPGQMVHVDTCMMPQGNRLFIRSCSHLYAIGDATVKYDWNPASRR
jgi:outer membrane protein assembly factor BamB